MAKQELDLWPNDLAVQTEEPVALKLLQEQAALLKQKTENLVEAKVRVNVLGTQADEIYRAKTARGKQESFFDYSFNLEAPSLKNYTYQLFNVICPASGYPLRIDFHDDVYEIQSEEEFTATLRKIFSHQETKRVIQSLISHTKSEPKVGTFKRVKFRVG